MARERMAKLLQYGHFEGRIGHIIINFMIISKSYHQRGAKKDRYLGSLPSDDDLDLTVRSAILRYRFKKISHQNSMCRSRERSENDMQSYIFVL